MIKLLKSLMVGLVLSVVMVTPFAQDATSIAEAKQQAEQKCAQGCLVLSPQEIKNIEANIEAAIQKAYQEGLKGWSKVS